MPTALAITTVFFICYFVSQLCVLNWHLGLYLLFGILSSDVKMDLSITLTISGVELDENRRVTQLHVILSLNFFSLHNLSSTEEQY